MATRTIYPDLARHGIKRLLLTGVIDGGSKKIAQYWKKSRGFRREDYVCLDSSYLASRRKHLRRLYLGFGHRNRTQMVVDIATKDLPEYEKSGTLREADLLSFCHWLSRDAALMKAKFDLAVECEFRYKRTMQLPFDPNPKSGVFVTGVKYGFSKKRLTRYMTIEKHDDTVFMNIATKPMFWLDPEKFNEHFFEGVVDRARNSISSLLKIAARG